MDADEWISDTDGQSGKAGTGHLARLTKRTKPGQCCPTILEMKVKTRKKCHVDVLRPIRMLAALAAGIGILGGCELNSFLDPSKVGRFEEYPSNIPILGRLDVIEGKGDVWDQATSVTPADLLPSDLTYRMAPGDAVTVDVAELIVPGQLWRGTRRIDATGNFRIPRMGDVPAAGLTAQEFQDLIEFRASEFLDNPLVVISVEEGIGFDYTVYGFVGSPGLYQLRRPDFRLLDAMAVSGGIAPDVQNVFIIRRTHLTEGTQPFSGRGDQNGAAPRETPKPVDIESLIEQMDERQPSKDPSPGVLRFDGEPIIDVDQVKEPGDRRAVTKNGSAPPADIVPSEDADRGSFIYVPEQDRWIRVESDEKAGRPGQMTGEETAEGEALFVQRIIRVPVEKLKHGDSAYNIVIRPQDAVYVQEPVRGVVFVQGEIFRPGAFNLNPDGKLTLRMLMAAAGGFSPISIPERVDLTRMVGNNRAATMRLNLAAIYRGTEPDVYLKPNDHVHVGTSFIAVPLAILRNGLRATYGFGLVLDRNFGNDVFGAPPVNRFGQ